MKLNVISLKIYGSQIFLAAKSYNLFNSINSVWFNYISFVPSTILTLFLKPRILQNVEEYHHCHYIDVPVRYSKHTRTLVPWSIDEVSSHWNHSIMPALSQSPFLVLRAMQKKFLLHLSSYYLPLLSVSCLRCNSLVFTKPFLVLHIQYQPSTWHHVTAIF